MSASQQAGRVEVGDCCEPVTAEVMSVEEAAAVAGQFKALGDPTRVRLLSLIAAHDGAQACVCDLTAPVGLSQPTVSHHLKILVDAGLLSRTKRGIWSYYALIPGALEELAATLGSGVAAGR